MDVTEILVRRKPSEHRSRYSFITILQKVDVPTIFFFLGILMAVAALQTAGHLDLLATWLDNVTNQNYYIIGTVIGILSSIVDNVPLVAGAIGMYPIAEMGELAQDGYSGIFALYCWYWWIHVDYWFCCWCSCHGSEKIDFLWYAKKISW